MDGRWSPDPTGRHELRWWDGERWTDHVADGGETATDPVDGGGAGPGAVTGGSSTWSAYDDAVSSTVATGGEVGPGGGVAWPDGATGQPPAGPGWPSSGAPSTGGGRGVRTGWVVAIAGLALVVGGVVGFVAGVAVDIGNEVSDGIIDFGDVLDDTAALEDAVPGDELALGATLTARASGSGVQHALRLDATTTIRLRIVEADFDTIIDVFDADGTLVGSDDDGGEGFNSSLDITLSAGEYAVVVRPFGFDDGGEYTLEVNG